MNAVCSGVLTGGSPGQAHSSVSSTLGSGWRDGKKGMESQEHIAQGGIFQKLVADGLEGGSRSAHKVMKITGCGGG